MIICSPSLCVQGGHLHTRTQSDPIQVGGHNRKQTGLYLFYQDSVGRELVDLVHHCIDIPNTACIHVCMHLFTYHLVKYTRAFSASDIVLNTEKQC